MKTRHVVLAPVILLLLATANCRQNGGVPLEELPKEIAVNLKPVPDTEILISTPPPIAIPSAVAPGPLPEEKECRTTQEFFSYVLYPVTICSLNPTVGDVLSVYQAAITPTALPAGAQDKTYRLSSFEGRSLTPQLTCHVRSGPWGATILKTKECSGVTSCAMAVPCLACPIFMWYGETCESQNRPTEVQFIPELTARTAHSSRCPGSKSTCGDEDPGPPGPIPAPQ
jgi:hypothetical protein